jgi:hypothetical protein
MLFFLAGLAGANAVQRFAAETVVSVGFLFALSMVSLRTLERGIRYEQ